MESPPSRRPVLVPFVCPACAADNAVELIALSRAGGMPCVQCERYLKSADVMRAMHAPRASKPEPQPARAAAKKQEMVWPPTPESRAAIAPLRRRRDGGM